MNNIEDNNGIGDLPPILIVRRSTRIIDQIAEKDGPGVGTIDLTSDDENDDVSGTGFHGCNRRTRTTSVPVKKRPVGSLEGDVFFPVVGGDKQKADERGVVKKGKRKRSKFYIVSKEKVGKHAVCKKKLGLNKRNGKNVLVDEEEYEEGVHNEVGVRKRICKGKFIGEDVSKNKGEKGVGCKVPVVDRIHQRISLWSLHRILPKLSTKQREDVKEMGFGAAISITRETVEDVLGIPMGNVPVKAVDEADCRHPLVIEWKRQFEGLTSYVLECLVRTKKSWIRTRHYCGPVIVLLVVYADSMRQIRGNGDVQMPLVNSCTVDLFNKLEEERLSPESGEASQKSVEAGELMHEADEDLDEALEENPTDEGLLQMKELRDANESTKPTEDGNDGVYCTPEKDVPKPWGFKDAPDEPFPFTQFYGTPSAYVAYSEQVSAERSNKEKRLRSDQVNVSKFNLNITQPPATQGRSVDVTDGDRSIAEAQELLESLQVYDSQDLPHFDCFTPERLRVGRQDSDVYDSQDLPHFDCFTPERLRVGRQDSDVSGNVCNGAITPYTICDEAPLQTIIPKDTNVLNDAEKYRDPKKLMCKVFCDTSLMKKVRVKQREWDVRDLADKSFDVKESSDKFIKGMMSILRTTVYGSLTNVDLVFFPIIQAGHFFVVCMHLKRKEVHILDNMLLGSEDVAERYSGLVGFLVARFEDFLSFESHPAQGFLRNARPQLLRLGCMTKNNVIACGVFAMRHMETYLFGGEYDDLCEFRREEKDQHHQLDELRHKYAAKILLADINNKKADFEDEAEAYKRLPLEERKRLEAASYETVKARVRVVL
ncbi:ulp1 protease family, C-terminal catalytic domain-containing protein [Artemisia annua]|uniref:Ulp1 protease family, C-terminal catalytic domain-containing protein n=1 Tax=Artemisia annua TaxID=35608 RepID=A0A2U1LLS5_ARTAN|nr:ulp1 protease family, C-terminal catalytic domain-containing protein [Artemisia annua]